MSKNAGDEKSKELFKKGLEKQGYTVTDCDTKIERGVKRPDLMAEKNGVTYYFELKQRDKFSYTFNDLMITDDKTWLVEQYGDKAYFVFFYLDGVCYVLNAHTPPDEIRKVSAPTTTRFYDNRYVSKTYLIWSVDKAQKFVFKPELIYT